MLKVVEYHQKFIPIFNEETLKELLKLEDGLLRHFLLKLWQKLNLIEFVKAEMIWTMNIKVQTGQECLELSSITSQK